MCMRKQFSQKLFDENDVAARKAAEGIKEALGIDTLEDSPNQYAVDLIGTLKGEFISYVEVERKIGWTGEKFPFRTVNLPGRKGKYAELILPTQFVIFNNDYSYAVIIHRDAVIAANQKLIDTVYSAGERFFDIPLSACKIVKKQVT